MGGELFGPFHKGRGDPGGWWIFIKLEVHFIHDVEVVVPDLAGWRRERMPVPPTGHRFKVAPDWVCEILSPSTEGKDRRLKLPLYARYGVPYVWLIDPVEQRLEAYRLNAGTWLEIGRYAAADRVSVPPFDAASIELGSLWMPARL